MKLITRFTQMFHCRVPIMGAPMADVSGGNLAAATSKGGGLGFVAAGHLTDVEELRRQIRIFNHSFDSQKDAKSKLCIGFIGYSSMANSNTDRVIQMIEEHRPFAVQFFAPAVVQRNVREAQALGSLVVAQVGSESDAVEALEAGVDCIVAQGREAGGHGLRPELATGTSSLASAIVTMVQQMPAIERPAVLAAGGFVDGHGLASALALGCDGVVFGTRLYASQEALGHKAFKQRLVDSSTSDFTRTRVFDTIMNTGSPTPWPKPYDSVGCLQNKTTRLWGDQAMEQLQKSLANDQSILSGVREANAKGDIEIGLVHAGAGVGKITSIESATKIIEEAEATTLQVIQRDLPSLVSSK